MRPLVQGSVVLRHCLFLLPTCPRLQVAGPALVAITAACGLA